MKHTHHKIRQSIPLVAVACLLVVFAIGGIMAKPERPNGDASGKKPVSTKVAPAKPKTEQKPPAQVEPTPTTPQTPVENTTPSQEPAQTEQPTSSASMTGEQIKWQVISAGGTSSTSGSYKLNGTIGQTATGIASSGSYKVSQGFWYSGSTGCCINRRGNVNNSAGDGVTVADLTYLVQYLFNAGTAPVCTEEANVNGTGGITVADLTYLVQYLFNAGTQPPLCPA